MRRRGIALVMVLLATALLGVIAFAVVTIGSRTLWSSRAASEREQALLAADAGLKLTLERLVNMPSYEGIQRPEALEPVGARFSTRVARGPCRAANGVEVPPGMHYVLATGTFREQSRRIGQMVFIQTSDFGYAIFANDSVYLRPGSEVLSVNGRGEELPFGHVGINRGIVDIGTGCQVDGDIVVGSGDPATALRMAPTARVHGRIRKRHKPRDLPVSNVANSEPPQRRAAPPDPQATERVDRNVELSPGLYGRVHVAPGVAVKLQTGLYVFDELKLLPGASLLADSVDLAVFTELDTRRGTVEASNLRVFSESADLNLGTGNYLVYAPGSVIVVDGKAEVRGALVGATVELQAGATLHYNTQLRDELGDDRELIVVSRQVF